NARAVCAAALIGAAECRCRGPSRRGQLGNGQARREDLRLQSGNVLFLDQRMIRRWDWVLPNQRLLWDERPEITHLWAHVAVRQLERRAGKRVRELTWMLVEAPGDLFVNRIDAQREVGDQHRRHVPCRWVEGVWDRCGAALRPKLPGASRALRQLPFVVKQ